MLLLLSLAVGTISVYGVPCKVTFFQNRGCTGTQQDMETDKFALTNAGDIYKKMSFMATTDECWKVMVTGPNWVWGGEYDGKTCYRDKCTDKKKNIEPNKCFDLSFSVAAYVKLEKTEVYQTGGVGTGGGNVHGHMKAGRSSGDRCDTQCAGQGTMEGYNTCIDNCDRYGGFGREYHDFLTDSFNCMDGCRSITDATAYDACAKACFAKNPMATYMGRRYEEAVFSRRQAEVAASRQSKPFWEQNAILFAIIFAAIASVAGLTYCLYEKKKVKKQVDAEGRDSVYTSITA